jgi:hypothetical protein
MSPTSCQTAPPRVWKNETIDVLSRPVKSDSEKLPDQVFWMTIFGNLWVMSFAFSATLTATLRAMSP